MSARADCLSLLFVASLATQQTCAQQTQTQPAPLLEPAVESAGSSSKPAPLQSPAISTASSLVTVNDSAALATAVAGTCTVIDALLMEICAQTPNDDYCRR
jgi:hypothetical protein